MSAAEVQTLTTRKAIAYQDYSEEFKASIIAAIEANGGNVGGTAKLFNVSPDTVRYWWANSERFREIQAASSGNLADKLENLAHGCADSLAEHDFSIVAARDKAAVMAVAIDKMQLLRGQPTEIAATVQRQELTIVLQSTLGSALELPAIDVTPNNVDSCALSDERPQEAGA